MSALRVWLLAGLALLLALANIWLHRSEHGLSYDEADYYQASTKGFWTNWTDADEIPFVEFASQGTKAVRGEISRSELSRQARERRSAAFMRHYHPPLALYPAIVVHAIAPEMPEETQLRVAALVWMVLWLAGFAVIMAMYPGTRSPWFVVLPASASWAVCSAGFNMHVLFGLAAVTFGYLWYVYEQDRSQTAIKRLTLFFLAVALFSVEYSLFLIGLLGLWGIKTLWNIPSVERSGVLRRWLVDLLWVVGTLLLLWPAGLIGGGLLRGYAQHAFIALFRFPGQGSSFSSLWQMLIWKWNASPLELGLMVAIIVAILWRWRDALHRGSLFVTLGFIATVTCTQLNPTLNLRWYLFPVYAIVYVFYLHVIATRHAAMARHATSLAVSLAAVLFAVAQIAVTEVSDRTIHTLRDAIAALPPRPIVAVQNVTPQISAYFIGRSVVGVHEEDLKKQEMQDKLALWSRDHILILPKRTRLDARRVVETTDMVVYAPYGITNGRSARGSAGGP